MASIVDIRLRFRPALPLTPFPFPVPQYTRKQVDNTLVQHQRLLLQSMRHTAKILGQRGCAAGLPQQVAFPNTSGNQAGGGQDTKTGDETAAGAGGGTGQLAGRTAAGSSSRGGEFGKSEVLGGITAGNVLDSPGRDEYAGQEAEFLDECWSDEGEDILEDKGGTGRARKRGEVSDAGAKVTPQEPFPELGQQLLTLQPNLQAFLVGAGRAFAQTGSGRGFRPGNEADQTTGASAGRTSAGVVQREGLSDDATAEVTLAVVTAAAAAAGAARRWFRSSRTQDGGGEGLRRSSSEVRSSPECFGMMSPRGVEALPCETEDLVSGAAALHGGYLQLLIEVYIRLAMAARKLLTRCLPAEKCPQLLPLQRIDDLVLPGGGVLEATGSYFRASGAFLDIAPEGNATGRPVECRQACVGPTNEPEDSLIMRLHVRRRSASEGVGQGQQRRHSTACSVSAKSSSTQGEEDAVEVWECGASGSSKEGRSFEDGKDTTASRRNLKAPHPRLKTPSGDVSSEGEVDCGDKTEEQGASSVEVKIMRLEPRAANMTAKELASIITSVCRFPLVFVPVFESLSRCHAAAVRPARRRISVRASLGLRHSHRASLIHSDLRSLRRCMRM